MKLVPPILKKAGPPSNHMETGLAPPKKIWTQKSKAKKYKTGLKKAGLKPPYSSAKKIKKPKKPKKIKKPSIPTSHKHGAHWREVWKKRQEKEGKNKNNKGAATAECKKKLKSRLHEVQSKKQGVGEKAAKNRKASAEKTAKNKK